MKFKNLQKEVIGDIRNKLTYPRAILERILINNKSLKKNDIKKAIKSIDKIPNLIDKWFKKFSKNE